MHTQIGKTITKSGIYTLHPLEWPETISYLAPMHIIKNQESIEVWPLRLDSQGSLDPLSR
jgi:hypothetical protein